MTCEPTSQVGCTLGAGDAAGEKADVLSGFTASQAGEESGQICIHLQHSAPCLDFMGEDLLFTDK